MKNELIRKPLTNLKWIESRAMTSPSHNLWGKIVKKNPTSLSRNGVSKSPHHTTTPSKGTGELIILSG
jgi:hypothetical protein